jgi:hypothetical protein
MKPIQSLGSLAGVAALWATGSIQAVVVSSSVVNLPINSGVPVSLDMDGDAVEDFSAFANAGYIALGDSAAENTVAVTIGSTVFSQVHHTGDTVGPLLTYDTISYLYHPSYPTESPSIHGSFDVGVYFTAGDGQSHYGWVHFDFPAGGAYPLNNSMVVSAAWESQADTPVVVVPEPSSLTGVGATLVLFAPWFWVLRRR